MKPLLILLLMLASQGFAAMGNPRMYRGWEFVRDASGWAPSGASAMAVVGIPTFAAAPLNYRGATAAGGFVNSLVWISTTAATDVLPDFIRASGWFQLSCTLPALGGVNQRLLTLGGGGLIRIALAATTSTAMISFVDEGSVSRDVNLAGLVNDGSKYTFYGAWDNANTKFYCIVWKGPNNTVLASGTNTANKINTTAGTSTIAIGSNNIGTNVWGGQAYYFAYGPGYYELPQPIRWYGSPPDDEWLLEGLWSAWKFLARLAYA